MGDLDKNEKEKVTMKVNGKQMRKGEIMTNSISGIKGTSYINFGTGNDEATNPVDKLNDGESKVEVEIPSGKVPSTSSVSIENKNQTTTEEPNVKSKPYVDEDVQHRKNDKVQKDAHTDICENRNEPSVSDQPSSHQDPLTCHNEEKLAGTVKTQTAFCDHGSDTNTSVVVQKVENCPEKDGCISNSEKTTTSNSFPSEQSQCGTEQCKRCEDKDFLIQEVHKLYNEVYKHSETQWQSKEKQSRSRFVIRKIFRGKSRETAEFYDDAYDHEKEKIALQEICFLRKEFEKMTSICKSPSPKYHIEFNWEVQVNKFRSKIEDLEQDVEVQRNIAKALNEKCDLMEKEMRNLEKEKEQLHKDRNDAIKAKEEALTRLSKVAAGKLRDDNPAITDLSDEDRPLNLAEKFSELYDNEWTDFYDDLAGKGKDDKEVVIDLLGLVRTIYEYCKTEKSRQVENLKNFGIEDDQNSADELDDDDDSDQLKIENTRLKRRKITRFLKSTRTFSLDVLKRKMKSGEVLPDVCDPMSKPCKKYVEKCMRLCWLMHIQDRQIVLLFEFDRDKPFSTDVYRHFTKVGKMGDYLVWPPMFLYEGGPLLQKGVIQPQ